MIFAAPDVVSSMKRFCTTSFYFLYLILLFLLPVDELEQCNKIVGKNISQLYMAGMSHSSKRFSATEEQSINRKYFPFKQGYPFVATLRVGSEGIQMTVDGKHITSFVFREVLSLSCFYLFF